MANPADDLYEIFMEWQQRFSSLPTSSRTTWQVRRLGSESGEPMGGWQQQRYAARCLDAIEHAINQMEKEGDDVSSERAYFAEWRSAVFAYPDGWTSSGTAVSESAMSSLGMFRNNLRRMLPDAGPDFLEELRETLRNEPSLTPPPGSYPVELYDYFTRVKGHLEHCIENYSATSTFDLQQAAEHYRAAVFMMANGHFVTNPADWGNFAIRVFNWKLARKFGSRVYDETVNELARSTARQLGSGFTKMIEAGPAL